MNEYFEMYSGVYLSLNGFTIILMKKGNYVMQQDAIGRSNLPPASGERIEDNAHGSEKIETRQASLAEPPYEQKPDLSKVLVIEDEENIIELIKLGLRYEGFQVEAVSDGLQGLPAAQRISPI